jgi:hypothetical protein
MRRVLLIVITGFLLFAGYTCIYLAWLSATPLDEVRLASIKTQFYCWIAVFGILAIIEAVIVFKQRGPN